MDFIVPITVDFVSLDDAIRKLGFGNLNAFLVNILINPGIDWVQFDFTCVKGVDYTVFFAVWDSSSDLLFMGWGVQAHPVRLVDFLF